VNKRTVGLDLQPQPSNTYGRAPHAPPVGSRPSTDASRENSRTLRLGMHRLAMSSWLDSRAAQRCRPLNARCRSMGSSKDDCQCHPRPPRTITPQHITARCAEPAPAPKRLSNPHAGQEKRAPHNARVQHCGAGLTGGRGEERGGGGSIARLLQLPTLLPSPSIPGRMADDSTDTTW
jgi:hypothetical protein